MSEDISPNETCDILDLFELVPLACIPELSGDSEIVGALVTGVIDDGCTNPTRATEIRAVAQCRNKALSESRDDDRVRLVLSATLVTRRDEPSSSETKVSEPAVPPHVAENMTTASTPAVKSAKRIRKAKPKRHCLAERFMWYFCRIRDQQCSGDSVATIIKKYGGVSEFTFKRAMDGRRVGSQSIAQLAETTFRLDPLSTCEFKIRWRENYPRRRYLTQERTANDVLERLNPAAFFTRRLDRKWSPAVRLSKFFSDVLSRAGKKFDFLSGTSPLDELDLPYSTVTATCRGESKAPEVFDAICGRLKFGDRERTIARILYVECLFRETLLGEDERLFDIPPYEFPRVGALLAFSANNVWELA
jgi:hypothetical protein